MRVSGRLTAALAATVAVVAAATVVLAKDEATSRPVDCPATRANGSIPPGESGGDYHGNGKLWTLLNRDGRFTVAAESDPDFLLPDGGMAVDGVLVSDGSVSIKQGWFRGPGARGRLRIRARRLDAAASGVQRVVPPSGYGLTGFQATGLDLPSTGCWRITGSAGDASLTFVTLIEEKR